MSSDRITLWDLCRTDGPSGELGMAYEFLSSAGCLKERQIIAPPQFLFFSHLIRKETGGVGIPDAIVILDEGDDRQLEGMTCAQRTDLFREFREAGVAGVFLCHNLSVPDDILSVCDELELPLIRVSHSAKILVDNLLELFHILTVSSRIIHGNMMDVFGLGLLIIGKSGIGKSECCLDLITKGHRLVADDSIRLYKNRHGTITATASRSVASAWMEIRGVGIIDVDLLYGISALRTRKDVDLVVELMDWDSWRKDAMNGGTPRLTREDIRRMEALNQTDAVQPHADDTPTMEVFGVQIPLVRIPVGPGRSIANLVEVSARKHLLALARKRGQVNLENWEKNV